MKRLNFIILVSLFVSMYSKASIAQWNQTTPVSPSGVYTVTATDTVIDSFTNRDMNNFVSAYKKKKRPKFVIFFNKKLNENIYDWSYQKNIFILDGGALAADKALTTETRKRSRTKTRRTYPERWEWQFETGFVQNFEKARVRLVDSTTVKRLMASSSMENSSSRNLSYLKNEMDALSKYAQFYIELLIHPAPSSVFGYEFRVRAINTHDGEIIARVSTLGLDLEKEGLVSNKYVATEHGYQKQQSLDSGSDSKFEAGKDGGYQKDNSNLDIDKIAKKLSELMLKKLSYSWTE